MLKLSTSFAGHSNARLGHGSNVQGLETTATYIPESDEFEIDSPTLTVFFLVSILTFSPQNGG
jgi:hypothetical protein